MYKIRTNTFTSINERPRIANKFVEDLKFTGRNDTYQFKTHNEINTLNRTDNLTSLVQNINTVSKIHSKLEDNEIIKRIKNIGKNVISKYNDVSNINNIFEMLMENISNNKEFINSASRLTDKEISKRLVKLISILIIQDAYSKIDAKEKRKIEDEALRGSKFGKIHS
ncbi:MAG: hypothetical protein RE471_08935 [Ferroplasma sp.]|uniref:hypothetical protein n=1 Tax=Ferroplasma sp. TaxID=2591003 RepID=UPI002816152D|nr:hypothetical protein [Ferroplasma sp.]WMT51088.1 MAG: hypothetical protein RE471_08935 [Ferroplasma sp.]